MFQKIRNYQALVKENKNLRHELKVKNLEWLRKYDELIQEVRSAEIYAKRAIAHDIMHESVIEDLRNKLAVANEQIRMLEEQS